MQLFRFCSGVGKDMTLHHWENGSWYFKATILPWKVRIQLSSHTSFYPCRI